jgi:phosphoribosyl 1,2-cyclic phosphodiesterase
MHVHFWGARGSLPAPVTAGMIARKLFHALKAAQSRRLESDEAIRAFIRDELPFAIGGSYGGNTSCVEIGGQDEYVLCDAGTGLRDFGQDLMKSRGVGRPSSSRVFHIFVSHLHWDHTQGFPFFTPAYVPGNRITIYGCHDGLEQAFAAQQSVPHFPVPLDGMRAEIEFRTLEPGRPLDVAGLTVTAIAQNHPGGSYGYRFTRGEKRVVYSTDAEHTEEAEAPGYAFLDFFREADLLIFDAQYTLLDAIDAKVNWGHSSNLLGVELAVRAGVKRLCLFHGEHTYDDEALDRFLAATRQYLEVYAGEYPLRIDLAYDGLEIEV